MWSGSSTSSAPSRLQHGLDAGVQLGGAEGLHDVVVGPGLQDGDHLRLLVAGRRHDDGYVADRAEHTQHLGPVDVREPQVEHDEVGPAGDRRVEPRHAGGRRRDGVPLVAQGAHEGAAQLWIVLHDEKMGHTTTVVRGFGRPLTGR